MSSTLDKQMLDRAARAALRGIGLVEPNPLVGAVLVRDGRVIGMGHHRRFGGPHAEADALADCRARGETPRGATMYVTLEPCNHHGKQPPCAPAVVAAGVARVVYARSDPNPAASGGAQTLQGAGIEARLTGVSPLATSLTDPFVKRIHTGLPWVVAKWAQTIDGRVATRTGESQWISGATSRRRVHRLRGCVDAIVTGIGTVKADDPRLTARDVGRVRRVAHRVVIDPRAELPVESALIRTIEEAPLTVVHDRAVDVERVRALAARGVKLLSLPATNGRVDLGAALVELAERHNFASVMIEAGPGLIGGFLRQDLIDELHVFIAPTILSDEQAIPAAAGMVVPFLRDARGFSLWGQRRSGKDALLVFRRARQAHG